MGKIMENENLIAFVLFLAVLFLCEIAIEKTHHQETLSLISGIYDAE
jgi:hypothetical protein